jgi:hypothetical protein
MSNGKDDEVLQEYLRGDSGLSRRYQAGTRQEPPEYLDNSILNAARAAISKQTKRIWYVPVSIAAVMVLGVSLLFRIYEAQGPQLTSEPEIDSLMKNKTGREVIKEYQRNGSESLPAVPAADSYRAVPDGNQKPSPVLQREIREDVPSDERIILKKQEAVEIQQPAAGAISMPAASKELPDGRTESIIQLQDKPVVDESVKQEAPALDTIMPAEPGISSGFATDLDEQQASNRPKARMKEPFGADNVPLPAEEWLVEISNQWKAGKKEDAITGLQQFLEIYPDYSKEELLGLLPEDFAIEDVMGD